MSEFENDLFRKYKAFAVLSEVDYTLRRSDSRRDYSYGNILFRAELYNSVYLFIFEEWEWEKIRSN